MAKVLLVVIDAASPRVVCPAVQTGRLPNLKRLADAGEMHQESITIFPSITPAATTSIVTGCYPAEHGIAGASWFDAARGEVAYYGDDFWVIAKEGFRAFVRDFLVGLNGDRLVAPTLFEMAERAGRAAGSVNYLVYKGLVRHQAKVPWLLAMLPGVPVTETVDGPSLLCLGDFVACRTLRHEPLDKGGIMHRFGMDDEASAELLTEIAAEGVFPDLTVAYFADNDYRSHEVGPHAALPVVERVDAALGAMFDAAGGFDRFMQDTCVIVTSDHGHCDILADKSQAVIHLHHILEEFPQADIGRPWGDGDELMICPNMRAAQLYVRDATPGAIERVTSTCLLDRRIDLVMWKREPTANEPGYAVRGPHGYLEFWRSGDGPASASARDAFGTRWSWRGDLDLLRFDRSDGAIRSSEYPNAFERIAGALDAPNSGEIWVTAQPGSEFEVPGGEAHVGGGSHGALHALDSCSPVIVAGAARPLPREMRSVDLAPLCLEVLGIPMRYRVGDARGNPKPQIPNPKPQLSR
jgi:hypothetical protein